MDDKFVVTGGCESPFTLKRQASQKVAEYTETGDVTYMPSMKTGRYRHACSKFVNDDGDTVSCINYIIILLL